MDSRQTQSDPAIFGLNLFGDPVRPSSRGPVADAFVEPPFTVLDARSGDWQDRKRAWASMGIQGEVGRDENLTIAGNAASFDYYRVKEGILETTDTQGTSLFDPVLCELQPVHGTRFGSVRGMD